MTLVLQINYAKGRKEYRIYSEMPQGWEATHCEVLFTGSRSECFDFWAKRMAGQPLSK